jgi:hypothetical protein
MKIKIEKLKHFLKGLPKTLALHPFLTFWILLFLALILSGVIYYKFSILAEKPGTLRGLLRFDQETYQEVKKQWQQREDSFKDAELRGYIDPFQMTEGISPQPPPGGVTSTPEEIILAPEIEKLLGARSLFEFYWLKGEKLPSIYQREIMWKERGLNSTSKYTGTKYQNLILLEKLKEELTE